ncbi:MAG TPA: hypothetical protein VMS92_06960, partial [Mycobacterium sp.]|nr:hypothetical protein [Mycobacterium sp.]
MTPPDWRGRREWETRMRRLVLCALAALAFTAAAEVAIRPGAWDLYSGTDKVATFATEASCIDEAVHRGDGRYTCRTRSVVSISNEKACGPDVGGWTRSVPTALDPTVPPADKAQPGTRLQYISPATGNDQTGQLYFWNGEQVVDAAGKTYGADPTNPTGAIKAFKRWAWVAPRRDANHDIGSKGEISGWPAFRYGYPDWWLVHRGETLDLSHDLQSFAVDMPGANVTYGSLALPGGRSPTERQVLTAYGDPCAARPRFIHPQYGFVYRADREGMPPLKNAIWQSLHFDLHDRIDGKSQAGFSFLSQEAASTDIVIEDVWMDATSLSINDYNAGHYTLRRSLITDAFSTDGSHAQGLYYEGARTGVLRIEESILLRNGFSHGDPSTMPWPPTGAQIWDLYDRNMYINGELDPKRSGLFDSVTMMGASGDQWRPGGRAHRNFIYQGYFNLGARGGYPDEDGFTGEILSNVLQRFEGTGTNDNRGQPGWGFGVGAGAGFIHVAGNIVTGAQHAAKWYGVELTPIQQDCYAPPQHATRRNTITQNIFDTGVATAGVRVKDGTTDPCFIELLEVPAVVQNTVSNNVIVNAAGVEHE